jgi:SAM-dependent methyltransferase
MTTRSARFALIPMLFLGGVAGAQIGPITPPKPTPTAPTTPAQPTAPAPAELDSEWRLPAVEAMRLEVSKIRPLIHSPDVERCMISVTYLPVMEEGRTIYVDTLRGMPKRALGQAEYDKLPEADRAGLQPDKYTDYRFYYTRYGTPVAYFRPLDLVAEHVPGHPYRARKILDFGFGTIGHLRLLASIGNEVVGVDVDPTLKALYSAPDDTGVIKGVGMNEVMPDGKLTLLCGHWPGDKAIAEAAGGDYDLIISKNTLKNGYINPEQEVDKRMLVDLGVPQEEFVAKVVSALKPGGMFMIYNICPAQKPKGEGFIPWADGRCPFPKEMLEKAGLTVLNYNTDDTPAAREMGRALGWDVGQSPMDLDHDLFATYTLTQKVPPTPKPGIPAPAKSKS